MPGRSACAPVRSGPGSTGSKARTASGAPSSVWGGRCATTGIASPRGSASTSTSRRASKPRTHSARAKSACGRCSTRARTRSCSCPSVVRFSPSTKPPSGGWPGERAGSIWSAPTSIGSCRGIWRNREWPSSGRSPRRRRSFIATCRSARAGSSSGFIRCSRPTRPCPRWPSMRGRSPSRRNRKRTWASSFKLSSRARCRSSSPTATATIRQSRVHQGDGIHPGGGHRPESAHSQVRSYGAGTLCGTMEDDCCRRRVARRVAQQEEERRAVLELASIAPVKEGEKITNFVAVKEDITERKQIEEQLRQPQKMQAVGQLTGGIAHDFNNLLAIVMGNLQLLQERVSGDAKAREYLDDALWSAKRGG